MIIILRPFGGNIGARSSFETTPFIGTLTVLHSCIAFSNTFIEDLFHGNENGSS